MKITLFHNPSAGTGEPDSATLRKAFERAGHALAYQSTKDDDFEDAIRNTADVIAVAGGDGTVRKVLRALASGMSDVPVLILPVGTANNIAHANGGLRGWRNLIRDLAILTPTIFRHGFVRGNGIDDFFFESVGIGVFASFMMVAEEHPKKIDALVGDLEGFPRSYAALNVFCEKQRTIPVEIISSGDVSGAHPMWLEVLNIPRVGPRIDFGSQNDSRGTEILKVACAGEEHRALIARWLADRSRGLHKAFPRLVSLHFDGSTRMAWYGNGFHIDDEIHCFGKSRELSLEIGRAPALLRILC